jgi:hypothetical protein
MTTQVTSIEMTLPPIIRHVHGIYGDLEKQKELAIRESPFYKDLVCPKNWKDHPFDRWFKLKEGYSSYMVQHLLEEFGARPADCVIDPFLGAGSTLVGARNASINGLGFEINPFSAKLASVKVDTRLDPETLTTTSNAVLDTVARQDPVTIEPPVLSITQKLFGAQLDDVLRAKQVILDEPDPATKDFLLIGFGCVLERAATARKDGNGLKYPKSKHPVPFLPALRDQYRLMIEDIRSLPRASDRGSRYAILQGDSRYIDDHVVRTQAGPDASTLLDGAKFSIFSPPYANCFDYTEVYKIELWMLDFITSYDQLKTLRSKSVSSHLNKAYVRGKGAALAELEDVIDSIPWEETWGKQKMRSMVLGYFDDMKVVFGNLDSMLKEGGRIVCIVGNSAYGNVPVATDLFLAQFLRDLCYHDIEIRVARQLGTSSQQLRYLGNDPFLRESLIIATK